MPESTSVSCLPIWGACSFSDFFLKKIERGKIITYAIKRIIGEITSE
jgi:hypothetical protein